LEVLALEEGFHCDIVVVDGGHLEVDVFVFELARFEGGFGGVVFG
jgi:hypothetical protein